MGGFSTRDSDSVEGMMNGCREPHGASPQPIRSEITTAAAAAAAQNLPGGCCEWYTAQFPECNWPQHATKGDTNIKAEREKQASDNLGLFSRCLFMAVLKSQTPSINLAPLLWFWCNKTGSVQKHEGVTSSVGASASRHVKVYSVPDYRNHDRVFLSISQSPLT